MCHIAGYWPSTQNKNVKGEKVVVLEWANQSPANVEAITATSSCQKGTKSSHTLPLIEL